MELENELLRLNRTLRAMSDSSQAIVRAQNEPEYLREVCRIIVEDCGHSMAWIGWAEDDAHKSVLPVCCAGFEAGYLETLRLTWADTERGRGPTGTCIRTGSPAICRNMLTDPRFLPWREQAVKRGYASSIALPLREHPRSDASSPATASGGRPFGALTVYCKEPDPFTPAEVKLLSELADDLAFGIVSLRLREAKRQAEESLRESEQRVRIKLESILSPEGDVSTLELADLIDAQAVQGMMSDFYQVSHIPMSILDEKGRVLVGVGWQDICTKFHRAHPDTGRHCVESDLELSRDLRQGEFRLYKCTNNMWDIATPIFVSEKRVGGIFSGQFFFDDETLDRETFRQQARRHGFDEREYLAALERVPRLSRATVDRGMAFFLKMADMLSKLGHSNVKLARLLEEGRKGEEALQGMVEELRRSNQELEQFAYIASHDLQEPLRQVRAFSQLLGDRYGGQLNGPAKEYLGYITEGAARMSGLVQDLLTYSRVGSREALRQPVPVQDALKRAMANLNVSIGESGARITHDELPTIASEPTQLAQLFQNLIGNAIKFRRDGVKPEVHVGARAPHAPHSAQEAPPPGMPDETGPQDGQWLFWVKDNGIGIESEHFERIFKVFQRLHARSRYAGTGIGLAICKKIVEQFGGQIWVESHPGEGSTFFFTLPEGA